MAMNINRFGISNHYKNSNQYKAAANNFLTNHRAETANMSKNERIMYETFDDEKAYVKDSNQNHDSIELSDDYKKWIVVNSQAQEEKSEPQEISNEQEQDKVSNEENKTDEIPVVPEEGKISCKVSVNVDKRMRQIAAAANRDQIQEVLALLNYDMADCRAGLKQGWCDEAEIAKVKRLISSAKEKMSKLPEIEEKDKDPLEEFAFDMASLL